MASQDELHSIRMQIERRRQPRHASVLMALNFRLEGHPYDLGDSELRELEQFPAFVSGSRGLIARPPHDAFLYGLWSVQSLINHVSWKSRLNSHEISLHIFERLKADLGSSPEPWLPLSRYADGPLSGYRSLSWWTSSDLIATDVIKGALELGLMSVPELAVLLRCPTDYVRAACRVPTAIDGFLSEVFHPTVDSDSPDSGMTIDLCGGENLTAGRDQYVLGPIKVDQVLFRPVHIDESMRSALCIESDQKLWAALGNYYSNL